MNLYIDQHQDVDQQAVHDRVKHERTGALRLEDSTRDGVHLGRRNDKKEEGRLHTVENTRVHVYIVLIFLSKLGVHFFDVKGNKQKGVGPGIIPLSNMDVLGRL